MSIYFCYLIGWTSINRFYYGCKYSKNSNPSQLWTSYFTSSKVVKETRKQFGEPDIIEIRKTFYSIKECRTWETKVLRRLNVKENKIWLNKSNGSGFDYNNSTITVRDKETNIYIGAVERNNNLIKNGLYIFHRKNQPNEKTKDKVVVLNIETNLYESVSIKEYISNKELLKPWLSSYKFVKNIDTNEISFILRNTFDNNVVNIAKDRIVVKDKNNNKFTVNRNDPRYISGELTFHLKGTKANNPMSKSRPKEKNGRWSGFSDDDYLILIEEVIIASNNLFKWSEIKKYVNLPSSRNHLRCIIEDKFNIPKYNPGLMTKNRFLSIR